jgi:hypothetical protein
VTPCQQCGVPTDTVRGWPVCDRCWEHPRHRTLLQAPAPPTQWRRVLRAAGSFLLLFYLVFHVVFDVRHLLTWLSN